jgi:hypothetical protein
LKEEGAMIEPVLNLMDAEILFLDPADVNPAIAELIKRDFRVEIHEDMIDEAGPTVFIRVPASASMTTRLSSSGCSRSSRLSVVM